MIGVAFLNELVFLVLGAAVGWMLGRRFQKLIVWLESKGIKLRGRRK